MLAAIRQKRILRVGGLLFPAAGWLLVFFLIPLAIVLAYSFARRGTYGGVVWKWNVQQYLRFVDPLYLEIFYRSAWIAVLTTAICLLVGYPFAYFIARQPARYRNALLLLIMIPFWTNFLIRTYAWILILRTEGLINTALVSLDIVTEELMAEEAAPEGAPEGVDQDRLVDEINIFHWSEYIDPEIYTQFEEEFGVRVVEDNFASNEDLLAKLQAGASRLRYHRAVGLHGGHHDRPGHAGPA